MGAGRKARWAVKRKLIVPGIGLFVWPAAAGFEPAPAGGSPAFARARAALDLYRETAALLDDLLDPEQHAVVDLALAGIRGA